MRNPRRSNNCKPSSPDLLTLQCTRPIPRPSLNSSPRNDDEPPPTLPTSQNADRHGIEIMCSNTASLTPPVLLPGPQWFKAPRFKLVHDPANSLRQGDVVAITPSWRESQHVRHVVKHIIAPCGPAIEARPPIPSMEERAAERIAKRVAKDERRALARCVENATLATTATGNLVRDVQKVLARVGAPPPL